MSFFFVLYLSSFHSHLKVSSCGSMPGLPDDRWGMALVRGNTCWKSPSWNRLGLRSHGALDPREGLADRSWSCFLSLNVVNWTALQRQPAAQEGVCVSGNCQFLLSVGTAVWASPSRISPTNVLPTVRPLLPSPSESTRVTISFSS